MGCRIGATWKRLVFCPLHFWTTPLSGLEWTLPRLRWTRRGLQRALAKQACGFWRLSSAYFHIIWRLKIVALDGSDRKWAPASERGEISPISPPLAAPLALFHWSGMLRAAAPLLKSEPLFSCRSDGLLIYAKCAQHIQWKVQAPWFFPCIIVYNSSYLVKDYI